MNEDISMELESNSVAENDDITSTAVELILRI